MDRGAQDLACLIAISLDLGDQVRDPLETPLSSQPCYELHCHYTPVQIASKVQ